MEKVCQKKKLDKIKGIQDRFKKNIGNNVTKNSTGKNIYPKISEMNVIIKNMQKGFDCVI